MLDGVERQSPETVGGWVAQHLGRPTVRHLMQDDCKPAWNKQDGNQLHSRQTAQNTEDLCQHGRSITGPPRGLNEKHGTLQIQPLGHKRSGVAFADARDPRHAFFQLHDRGRLDVAVAGVDHQIDLMFEARTNLLRIGQRCFVGRKN